MSSGIASMLLVALILCSVIVPLARRKMDIPTGAKGVLEVIVVFVRDMIARPALHEKAYNFLPLLLTLFVFILGMNLIGLFPLEPISHAIGLGKTPIGITPTQILTVCAGLASLSLLTIVFCGLRKQAQVLHEKRRAPFVLCMLVSPLLWLKSLSPKIEGVVGVFISIPLAFLELIGAFAKCFALMIRLFANMMAGHALLAVMMMFIFQGLAGWIEGKLSVIYIAPACILASVVVNLLELLVAGLQAYIFTFLTAMFLGMYVEAEN